MEKSPEAFRTISEVADLLDTPAHVLRFWESRFPQIRPVKRAGGRRYYRPGDVALLAGIKKLLHDDGLTIRGVQKILREQGIRHVSGLAAPLPDPLPGSILLEGADEARDEAEFLLSVLAPAMVPSESAQIIPLDQAFARQEAQRGSAARDSDAAIVAGETRQDVPDDVPEAPEAPFIEAEETEEAADHLPLFATATKGHETVVETVSLAASASATADVDDLPDTPDAAAPAAEAPGAVNQVQPEESVVPPAEDAVEEPSQPHVAAILRRRRLALSGDRRTDLLRLHDRLADLRDRVAEASRRRVR